MSYIQYLNTYIAKAREDLKQAPDDDTALVIRCYIAQAEAALNSAISLTRELH